MQSTHPPRPNGRHPLRSGARACVLSSVTVVGLGPVHVGRTDDGRDVAWDASGRCLTEDGSGADVVGPSTGPSWHAFARVFRDTVGRLSTPGPSRHRKRGKDYLPIMEVGLQTETPLHDGTRLLVYVGGPDDGWARPPAEFSDGRFVPTTFDDRATS